jgi:hypothetical protein
LALVDFGFNSRLITEQPGSEIVEASAPGLPFVIGPRRGIEDVLDSGSVQRLMHCNRVCVEPRLGSASAKPEHFDFLVERIGVAEYAAGVASRSLVAEGRSSRQSTQTDQMPEREIEGLHAAMESPAMARCFQFESSIAGIDRESIR